MTRNAILVLPALAMILLAGVARADLTAENLLLIVNRNVPEGRELAEFYQQARGVPEGRILELDLPAGDRLPRRVYEQTVVPAVRQFLADNGLRDQVLCAVTFYGIPLAVDGKTRTDAERQERAAINQDAEELGERLAGLVREAEEIVRPAGFQAEPWVGRDVRRLEALLGRLGAIEGFLGSESLREPQRGEVLAKLADVRQRLEQPFEPDPSGERGAGAIRELLSRTDSEGRRLAREAIRARAPLPEYAGLLARQQRYLSEEDSDASFDSELATLWLDSPPAAQWIINPMAHAGSQRAGPPILMTSRLDGRDPRQVREMIETSLSVELAGLAGKIVVDSRGIAIEGANGKADGYGVFDEQLRRLAALLKEKTDLAVVHDDAPDVIQPPGEQDVALYVGWYSLMKYIPAYEFAAGAVGYHVASFEMRSLRDPRLPGWVRGLLDSGVVATLGPVSEPYLAAFPPPEEFFPLLLTGELTLAEVYWRTVPLVSWKLGLIGDPMYTPYARKPGMAVEALPMPLREKVRD